MNNIHIKEFLIDTEILTPEDIEKIQDKIFSEGKTEESHFLETALSLNLIQPEVAQEILSLILTIPRIDLEKQPIDLETYSILPEPISREKKAVVFKQDNNKIYVAVAGFENINELQEILSEFDVSFFLSDISSINKKIIHYQNLIRDN